MSATSKTMSSTASSDLVFTAGALSRTLMVRRHAAARKMRLAVDPRDGTVRLTLPTRAPLRPALVWAESQRPWVESALAKVVLATAVAAGATIPYLGVDLILEWRPDLPRAVRPEGDRLLVGGARESVAARVSRWLRAEALRLLTADTAHYAMRAGVTIGRVSIGDPRSRWGSCAASGDIRYSWRLVMAPPAVREAVVAHEVAHRLHMNHGPDFHRAVKAVLGRDPRADSAWLRAHGAALHRVGATEG